MKKVNESNSIIVECTTILRKDALKHSSLPNVLDISKDNVFIGNSIHGETERTCLPSNFYSGR